jgi:hypothetical protein
MWHALPANALSYRWKSLQSLKVQLLVICAKFKPEAAFDFIASRTVPLMIAT